MNCIDINIVIPKSSSTLGVYQDLGEQYLNIQMVISHWIRTNCSYVSFSIIGKKGTIIYSLLFTVVGYLFTFCLQDDLLKVVGEKHQLYEFLNTFYIKCSYLLFNKEHVKAILSEINTHKSAENDQHTQSCMNILVVRICHFQVY